MFGMVIVLGAHFQVHLCWMDALFLHFCFLFGLLVFVAWGSGGRHDLWFSREVSVSDGDWTSGG